MPNLKSFYTGFLTPLGDELANASVQGMEWTASFLPPIEFRANPFAVDTEREIVIEATSEVAARKARDLVWFSMQLFDVPPTPLDELPLLIEPNAISTLEDYAGIVSMQRDNFRESVRIAAEASLSHDMIYAMALFFQSRSLHCNHHSAFEPYEYPYPQRSDFPIDHIRFAYAIVTSYAVVEQLRLEVRAMGKRPAIQSGVWDVEAMNCLSDRLRKAHIEPSGRFHLTLRGCRTEIEEKFAPTESVPSAWGNERIRDSEVSILDAIAYLRDLRNNVAAHRARDWIRNLSVHDVFNAQLLVRRLILESFYKTWPPPFVTCPNSETIESGERSPRSKLNHDVDQ